MCLLGLVFTVLAAYSKNLHTNDKCENLLHPYVKINNELRVFKVLYFWWQLLKSFITYLIFSIKQEVLLNMPEIYYIW